MLIISELNYLLSQKVPTDIFTEDEKAIIYYDDKDTIPAKAFAWLNKISGKMMLLPYTEIGGRDNISFAVGGYVVNSKTGTAVIVGSFDAEVRTLKIGSNEYKIYTTTDFQQIPNLKDGEIIKHEAEKPQENLSRIDKLVNLLPPKSVPSGMDAKSFAQVLDSAIARSRGNNAETAKYVEETLGRNVSDNLQILYNTGIYNSIVETVLKG